MARVLAQKMTGSCRMCASCSAVTKTGYLVKRGGAELFVCQSCLTAKFGTDYQLVRSLEPEPPRPVVQPRPVVRPRQVEPRPHPAVRPRQVVRARPEIGRGRVLRELAALVNRGVQMLRAGLIVSLLLLVVMYGAKERPAIRPPDYVQYQMNKVERQAVRLQGRVLNIFTKERSP
jgi:hypothetical protein